MSSVVIKGDTSGQTTLTVPAVAGTNTLTLPSVTATIATNTNGDLYPLTSGTAVASTSGTSIDFTSIPSWVKRITVMFNGVSTSATSLVQFQLGTGATPTYTTSGYASTSSFIGPTSVTSATVTSGFALNNWNNAANVGYGAIVFTLLTGTTWVASGVIATTNAAQTFTVGGSIALAATLTAVRITTVGGTDTFDAGSINILYE